MMKKVLFFIAIAILYSCSSSDESEPIVDETNVEEECLAAIQLITGDVFLTGFTISFNPVGNVRAYDVEYGEEGFAKGQGTVVQDVSASEFIEVNLKGNTTYEFYVISRCADGGSVDSDRKAFTTETCPVPNIIDAINITETSALVRFSDIQFIDSYEVEYGPTGFGLGAGTVVSTNTQQVQLSGLSGGTLYDVYVRTNCGGEFGGYSSVFTFETVPLCFRPTDLEVRDITSTSVRLSWDPNGETAWQIQYGLVGFTLGSGTTINTSNRPFRIENLNNNTTYEFYIRANCGSDGFSNWSESIVVTTE